MEGYKEVYEEHEVWLFPYAFLRVLRGENNWPVLLLFHQLHRADLAGVPERIVTQLRFTAIQG